jgi:hypothetical protein
LPRPLPTTPLPPNSRHRYAKRRVLQHSSTLIAVPAAIRQRAPALIAFCVAALAATATPAAASSYGELIVRHDAAPSTTLATNFTNVRPKGSFLLVVTEPTETPLSFRWSIRCVSATRREHGGASGTATVSNGHWVKRVRTSWIKHPASCSGSVEGAAASSPVLVRVFAAS